MSRRCEGLHRRYRRRETLGSIDWVCDDCGEVVARMPVAHMRSKTAAQRRRIVAHQEMDTRMEAL